MEITVDWHNLGNDQKVLHITLPMSAIVAVLSLYFTSSYRTMLETYLIGAVIGTIIAVPDWPYFCRSPLSWYDPLGIDTPSMKPVKPVHSAKKPTPVVSPYSTEQDDAEYRLS